MSKEGHIYILINPVMKGLVKIGITSRDPEERAAELSQHTGVPRDYVVAYDQFVSDCERVEKLVHQRLENLRVNKEFFKIALKEAVSIVCEVSGPFEVSKETVDKEEEKPRDDWECSCGTKNVKWRDRCSNCDEEYRYLLRSSYSVVRECCPTNFRYCIQCTDLPQGEKIQVVQQKGVPLSDAKRVEGEWRNYNARIERMK